MSMIKNLTIRILGFWILAESLLKVVFLASYEHKSLTILSYKTTVANKDAQKVSIFAILSLKMIIIAVVALVGVLQTVVWSRSSIRSSRVRLKNGCQTNC